MRLRRLAAHLDGAREVGERGVGVAGLGTQAARLGAEVQQVGACRRGGHLAVEQHQGLVELAAAQFVVEQLELERCQPGRVLGVATVAGRGTGGQSRERGAALVRRRVRGEERVALRRVAAGRCGELGAQLVPHRCRGARLVAGLLHQLEADQVGLPFLVAREAEGAGQCRELADGTDQSEHRHERTERGARLDVAQPVERVALHVVADLVAEHGRELRFVVDPQQQAAPDLHHAVRGHAGVEERGADRVDADVGAVRGAELARDALQVLAQALVAHQERAAAQACFLAVHHGPQAPFVGRDIGPVEGLRCGPVGAHGGQHGAGFSFRAGPAREQARALRATRRQPEPALHLTTGKPLSKAWMVSVAAPASRRSPLERARRLNQSTRPESRSTSDA